MAETIFSIERGPEEELIVRFKKPKTLHMRPAPVRGHFKAAGREVLLAFRRALDEAISAIECDERPKERGNIEVE
jgi:hypothetical protein